MPMRWGVSKTGKVLSLHKKYEILDAIQASMFHTLQIKASTDTVYEGNRRKPNPACIGADVSTYKI